MIKKIIVKNALKEANLIRRSNRIPQKSEIVEKIINDVIRFGDSAVLKYTKKYDKIKINSIRVEKSELERAYNKVTNNQLNSLKRSKKLLEKNERILLSRLTGIMSSENGITIKRALKPMESVGCYVPGGRARYPSTLMMCAVPAMVAGVNRISVVSPPMKDGGIDPVTLVAADICGIDEVYSVGGAQAVAALAYGTETIKKVDKIVGPGGLFVNIAKFLVSNKIAIDMIAGPTELLIYADSRSNPRYVVKDLISQAEHSQDTICGVVTTSESLVKKLENEINNTLNSSLLRSEIILSSLKKNGFIALCKNEDDCISFMNELAPEHLQVISENPSRIASRINTAGVVLLGKYSPSSASDYCLGSNHVLPTIEFGKSKSSLSVLDFVKLVNHITVTKTGLQSVQKYIKELAFAEGLPNHYF
ncbi:MAG TPA: histidinol dehydrogenase, partial [Nitrososphaeraceae archaeon]|nr:histidinol dehydrogenase [Nitrososphaeraceae archaeon]